MRPPAIAAACAFLAVAGCRSGPADADRAAQAAATAGATIRVAAASDLRFAMDELVASWEAANPDRTVEPVYGSSGNAFAQIAAGAPFDLYFSADAAYPRRLEDEGLAERGATRLYGNGQIVVWVSAESAIDVEARGIAALADAAVQTVAIANPEHAPYGRAAVAAMRSAGVYDAVAPKIVYGENVSQAAQFVASGNADAGVIALALALAPTLAGKGRYAMVPSASYPPIEQGAVVLRAARNPVAAEAFLDFTLGPQGRRILDRYGYLRPAP